MNDGLLVRRLPGRKTVAAGIWVTTGAAHEPAGVAGATHIVEHLTLRACGDRDRRSLAMEVDRLGGEVDAWTSSELMGVSVNTTLDAIDNALELLVDAVLHPTFAEEDVELERRVTLAEIDLISDDPAQRVEEALLRAAWGDHPLARPVIGTRESVLDLTSQVLRSHHASLVRPGRLLAAVVGDVDELRIASVLARLDLREPPRIPDLPPLVWSGSRLELNREGTEQIHARLGFEAPSISDRRATVVAVLSHVLGEGAASRLFQRLREDEGLTYDIWSGPMLRGPGGLLEIGWACAPQAFADARRLVTEEIARLPNDLTDEEIEVAKEGFVRGLTMDAESPAGSCALDVSEVLERNRRFDFELVRREVMAISIDEVRDLAREVLRPEKMASAVCGPENAATRVA